MGPEPVANTTEPDTTHVFGDAQFDTDLALICAGLRTIHKMDVCAVDLELLALGMEEIKKALDAHEQGNIAAEQIHVLRALAANREAFNDLAREDKLKTSTGLDPFEQIPDGYGAFSIDPGDVLCSAFDSSRNLLKGDFETARRFLVRLVLLSRSDSSTK